MRSETSSGVRRSVRRMSDWLSTMKWLFLSLTRLPSRVLNPFEIVTYYALPGRKLPLMIKLVGGHQLEVPWEYPFQAIAEALLLDVYHLSDLKGDVIVDVGAGIGDFLLLASQNPGSSVYCFEPDPRSFLCLQRNARVNNLENAVVIPRSCSAQTIHDLLHGPPPQVIAFLKMDCEGCEYTVLRNLTQQDLSRIRSVHIEIHDPPVGESRERLKDHLVASGYDVSTTSIGGCTYLHAIRPELKRYNDAPDCP